MEENTVTPDQTAPKRAVQSGSILFAKKQADEQADGICHELWEKG